MTAELARARVALDALEREHGRLVAERAELLAASSPGLGLLFPVFGLVALVGDAAGLDDRAHSIDTLIATIEDFVGEDFGRMEAKALAGDAAQALRLRVATERILAMVSQTSVVDDTIDDVVKTVKETQDDAVDVVEKIARVVGAVGGGVLAAGAASTVADLLRAPPWVRLGAAVVAGLGGAVGGTTLAREAARALTLR